MTQRSPWSAVVAANSSNKLLLQIHCVQFPLSYCTTMLAIFCIAGTALVQKLKLVI
ncbi:MAG: hypothetical protein OFPI_25050 [Osedax symbiont Rs2]|nr:MAG: hypothetical protein OFPI_25050 [Osedax symbiont Rs2]